MATHCSSLACRIPRTEEPVRLQSTGLQKSQTQPSLHTCPRGKGCGPGETISPEGGQRGGDHHVLVPQELSQCCRKPLRDRPREPFASSPGLPLQGKSETDLHRMLELLMSICTSQIQALEAEDLTLQKINLPCHKLERSYKQNVLGLTLLVLLVIIARWRGVGGDANWEKGKVSVHEL